MEGVTSPSDGVNGPTADDSVVSVTPAATPRPHCTDRVQNNLASAGDRTRTDTAAATPRPGCACPSGTTAAVETPQDRIPTFSETTQSKRLPSQRYADCSQERRNVLCLCLLSSRVQTHVSSWAYRRLQRACDAYQTTSEAVKNR